MRDEFEESLLQLQRLGYRIAATPGTASFYTARGVTDIIVLRKPGDEAPASPFAAADSGIATASTTAAAAAAGQGGEQEQDQALALVQGAVLEWIRSKQVDLVINIPEGTTRTDEITAGYRMRRTAVDFGCSLLTNIKYVQLHLLRVVTMCTTNVAPRLCSVSYLYS